MIRKLAHRFMHQPPTWTFTRREAAFKARCRAKFKKKFCIQLEQNQISRNSITARHRKLFVDDPFSAHHCCFLPSHLFPSFNCLLSFFVKIAPHSVPQHVSAVDIIPDASTRQQSFPFSTVSASTSVQLKALSAAEFL